MQMTLWNAACTGNAANCIYPNKAVVNDATVSIWKMFICQTASRPLIPRHFTSVTH